MNCVMWDDFKLALLSSLARLLPWHCETAVTVLLTYDHISRLLNELTPLILIEVMLIRRFAVQYFCS